MKKLFAIIISALLCIGIFSACSTNGVVSTESGAETNQVETSAAAASTESTEQAPGQIIIGYNAFTDTVIFSKNISDNLQENCDRIGAKLLKAETSGDATKAMQNANAFIQQGANVIIDSSWTIPTTEAVSEICSDANIPFISIDIPVENGYFMGTNNFEDGKIAGAKAVEYVNNNWDGNVDYLVLMHIESTGEEVKKRVTGVVQAFEDAGFNLTEDQIVYVDPMSADATIACKQLATDFLTAHPDAKHIVFGTTNCQGAKGFFSGIETSNRQDDCIIVGQAMDNDGLSLLRQGDNCFLGAVAFFPEKYGNVLIEMVQKLVANEPVEHNNYMDSLFIDRSNMDQYYPES